MTSINALRFDKYSGICIGDESISTVAEIKINVGEKVSPFIPGEIVENYGIVGALGSTGTCSIGDTIQEKIENKLRGIFHKEIEKTGKKPDSFMNLEEIMALCFDVVIEIKNSRISEKIKGTYNFTVPEFIEGKYKRNDETYEIKDKDVIRKITEQVTWKNKDEEVGFIYLNAGLVAGYDNELGFQIYHFDLRDGYWHRVQNCYMAEGSGRHSVDPAVYGYAEKWLLEERRGNIDPVEGSIALIHGVNYASDHEIGVGGYYNIILIDGREKDYKKRLREINDDRSLLANHIVRALDSNFLTYKQTHNLIKKLLFEGVSFEEIYDELWSTVKEPEQFSRILRGYKIIAKRLF
ncbi:MAG: hypothetical protein K8T10_04590 [Candidatus Eremiobacteraeota bacterium]|nr:hypothetical protein [Candidatus Eremiobacteraeota bacterium]